MFSKSVKPVVTALRLLTVEEREDLVDYFPPGERWTFFLYCVSPKKYIELPLELHWNYLQNPFGYLPVQSLQLHLVLIKHES